MRSRKTVGGYVACAAILLMGAAFFCSICQASARSFGFPANGFVGDFENGSISDMTQHGFFITSHAVLGARSLECDSSGTAYYPNAYLRGIHDSVDAGWRRISQGAISSVIVSDSALALGGVGFMSDSGSAVFALLKVGYNQVDIIQRKIKNGVAVDSLVKEMTFLGTTGGLTTGTKYKLEFLWSPYANAGVANLYSLKGNAWVLDTSEVGLSASPTALRPALFCTHGAMRFDSVAFDPNLDNWNYDWEFYEQIMLKPVKIASLAANANYANAIHWKWKNDGKFYMHARNGTTYSAPDVLHWTRLGVSPIWTVSDCCYLVDPFGDGYVYKSGRNMAWYRSNASSSFVTWDSVATIGKNTSGMTGAMQECLDVKQYPGRLDSISYGGKKYRFIGLGEQTFAPYSTAVLSNDLHTWVRPDTMPVPARFSGGWQQTGDAIGCGFPMADGNILIICCTCTSSGYTGTGFESSGVSSVLSGKQPWVTQKVSKMPMTPVSQSDWTWGPNMPQSFVWDSTANILYFFSDFHDSVEGVLRVRNLSSQAVGIIGNSGATVQTQSRISAVVHGNQISITLPKPAASSALDIALLDVRGRVVYHQHAVYGATAAIPIAFVPDGLYVLTVRYNGQEPMWKTVAITR